MGFFNLLKIKTSDNQMISEVFCTRNRRDNETFGRRFGKNCRIKYFCQVTKTSESLNTFIDDLVRLSQIKQELQNSFLSNNFF
jgi:hypothetical protein